MEKASERPDGIDLSDLTEYPLALLDENRDPNRTSILVGTGERGIEVRRHAEHGFFTGEDIDVLLGLLCLFRGCDAREPLALRPADLLDRIGWRTAGHRYDRLRLAGQRLRAIEMVFTNTLHDPQTGTWQRRKHLSFLAEFSHYQRSGGQEAPRGAACPPWEFQWSPSIAEIINDGRWVFTFDLETYSHLKRPITQACFRYLFAKIRDGKPVFKQHLESLAYDHVGIARKALCHLKRQMGPVLDELVGCGLLSAWELGKMGSGPQRGEPMLIASPARPPKPAPPPARHREAPPASGGIPNTMGAGSRPSPRIASHSVTEAFPPAAARNGSPADEELPLVKLFRQRKERTDG